MHHSAFNLSLRLYGFRHLIQITVALDSNRASMLLVHPSLRRPGRAFASSSSRSVESDMHASPITAAQALQLQRHMQPSSILHAFGIPLHGLDFRCCALGSKNTMIVGSRDPCCCTEDQKSDTTQTNTYITPHCIYKHTSLTWRCCDARCYVQDVHQEALFLRDPPDSRRGCPPCF